MMENGFSHKKFLRELKLFISAFPEQKPKNPVEIVSNQEFFKKETKLTVSA